MKSNDKSIISNTNNNNWIHFIKNLIILFLIFNFYNLKKTSSEFIKETKLESYNSTNNTYIQDTKLYWNEQTSLDIDKILEEIKNFKPTISFDNKNDFIKKRTPKISLVITLYNQSKHIMRIYSSIQKQLLKNIEIIFVDDNSGDNSTKIVGNLMMKDKRIVYLKNSINKGAYYSRNLGIIKSSGEYIICVDSDDMLINNILLKAYDTAKKYKLDIVHFYVMIGYYESPKLWKELKYKGGILKNNEEIRENFYKCKSRNLWDKLVKADIFKKSTEYMRKEFYDKIYYVNNDNTAFFNLLHTANTYGFLEQVGYFYITRPKGSYYYRTDPKKMNLIFLSIFNNMRYFYLQSDDNIVEKKYLAFEYFNKSIRLFGKFLPNVTVGFNYFLKVLDLYINSSYFNNKQKKKLNFFKSKLIERMKRLKYKNDENKFKFY